MNIEIRYQSRWENIKAVALEIENKFNVDCKTAESPIDKYTDVLLVGGGIYAWE